MIELTNAETGKKFILKAELIVLITDAEEGVFVWTDIEKKIGFKVSETYAEIKEIGLL